MEKFKYDNFVVICERICNEVGVKKDKELIEMLGTTQPTFSRRKNEGQFPVEWAYLISRKFDLLTEWILTGKGPKKIGATLADPYFADLEKWGKEVGKSNNIEWLKAQIELTFPMFKQWRKRKEVGESESGGNPQSNVA